jgi:ketosteroid isomerase-like protein
MADEKAEVVRKAWAAASRRDIPAMLACLDPEVEAVPLGAAMESRVYRGHQGVAGWLEREVWATYETFEVHPDETQAVGERLLVFGHWIARGRESGVELEVGASWVVDVRDGKITRWQTYTDRDEALAAVGLKA